MKLFFVSPFLNILTKMMQLLSWIDESKLDYDVLSRNPSDGALDLLELEPENF